jgi:starch-binding outer membrane protein, SusD/RagB family
MKKYFLLLFIPALVFMGGCRKELLNPNAATGESVLNNVDGLLGLVVGIKKEYAVGATGAYYNMIAANGLTTKELYVLNTGNGELAALETGKTNLGAANAFLTNVFASSNAVKAYAQQLIDNGDKATDPAMAAYLKGYGHFFKALSIGTMANFWENIPLDVITSQQFLDGKRAAFVTREVALQEAIRSLELINVTAPAPAYFTTKVGGDLDIINASKALKARYSTMLKNWPAVIAAAKSVDMSKKSVFKYETINQNPVFRTSLTTNNVFNGLYNFGLSGALAPDSTDGRIALYFNANTTSAPKVGGFWKADDTAVPVYLPSEMTLLLAEAEAQSNTDLTVAIGHLNTVRKKATDPFSVTAKLTDYAGPVEKAAVLQEIYRQRCIELYMSGMKLEDSRRFGRPGPNDPGAERSRNWYPYPQRERDTNPNTPKDPAI